MTILLAFASLGILLGATAYASTPVFLAAASVIAAWLLVFLVREQLSHRHR